jgi:hypothetical protein
MSGTLAFAAGYPTGTSKYGFSCAGRPRIRLRNPIGEGVWVSEARTPPEKWSAASNKVGGTHAAGLGTDFDGIEDPPDGLEDVSKLPVITEELLRRGHSEQEVRGVLGENFLRFWVRAEAARRNVPARKEPLPFSKP